ncbi:LemA family protein [Malaciobacter molluscorum LMG 25693]|uniref:LemA family protein n=1 Tax=Malaciobacter molluscorum LMG 25693 TaxID=870501 RepID=A0A2G1DHF8_9BACT|nr:LemA family protein [Malaciobacter molluscorum]AXX93667.1 LemA protein [Malaciobacter molluscorum LMG 25693]PHO17923.1 LemA family protein [Malaciobacter molluscorum LMG 25693]
MRSIFITIGIIVLAFIILITTNINNIPKLDENVNAAWSQVQNQYKRRADLIPNLVATVKGYAKHEKSTLEEVTKARASVGKINISENMLSNAQQFEQFQKAQGALSSALSRLMIVVEKYPQLKADKNFLALQSQLEGTENRISVARRDYIQTVKKYNTELRTYPGKIVAAIIYPEAKVKQNFTASLQDQETPKVNF